MSNMNKYFEMEIVYFVLPCPQFHPHPQKLLHPDSHHFTFTLHCTPIPCFTLTFCFTKIRHFTLTMFYLTLFIQLCRPWASLGLCMRQSLVPACVLKRCSWSFWLDVVPEGHGLSNYIEPISVVCTLCTVWTTLWRCWCKSPLTVAIGELFG